MNFPQATFAQTAIQATAILNSIPIYQRIVNECLLDVPDSMFDMCLCASAEVYKTGMLATAFESVVDLGEEFKNSPKARRKLQVKGLKEQRTKIFGQLQTVGILPTGLCWLLVRWFVLPFLLDLLKRWAIGPDEDLQDQG